MMLISNLGFSSGPPSVPLTRTGFISFSNPETRTNSGFMWMKGSTVVVFGWSDCNICFSRIRYFSCKGINLTVGQYTRNHQMSRPDIKVMVWKPHHHVHEHVSLFLGCCDSNVNRALVILWDVVNCFWTNKLYNVWGSFKSFCSKEKIRMTFPQIIVWSDQSHTDSLDMFLPFTCCCISPFTTCSTEFCNFKDVPVAVRLIFF